MTTLQLLVVNLVTLNITIAVLSTRYDALTSEFSRAKYEQWLTKCLADFIFKRSLIRGGRCRAFLLHLSDADRNEQLLSGVERLQLRLMTIAEAYLSQRRWCDADVRVLVLSNRHSLCVSGSAALWRIGSGMTRNAAATAASHFLAAFSFLRRRYSAPRSGAA